MTDNRIAKTIEAKLAKHVFFVNKNKPCFYEKLTRVGLPPAEYSGAYPGSSTSDRIAKFCMGAWYTNIPLMKFMVDFIREQPKEGKVFHSVSSTINKEAAAGFIMFLDGNIDTIAQLGTGFDFEKGYNPFIPKVSKSLLEMSYAERQALLRKTNENRLELAPTEPENNA